MRNVAIIGLGKICEHYIKAFTSLDEYNVVAICDLDENAYSRKYFSCDFYRDYKDLALIKDLDFVVISTPPKTHHDIAVFFLANHIGVFLEKPATLNMVDLDELITLSKVYKTTFKVMYHWQFGSEILKFNELYNKELIEEINVCVYDRYSKDGVSILPDRVGLGGAFLDSGVNMLSMIKTWLPFSSLEIISHQTQHCVNTGLVIKADVRVLLDNIPVRIIVDWTQDKNNKETHMIYQGRSVEINNLKQTIFDGDNIIKVDEMDRLDAHYYNLFRLFDGKTCHDDDIRIHKTLFNINKLL